MPNSDLEALHSRKVPIKTVYDHEHIIDNLAETYANIKHELTIVQRRGESVYDNSLNNLNYIMQHDPMLEGICYNQLTNHVEVHLQPSWTRDQTLLLWNDRDTIGLRSYLARVYNIEFKKGDVEDAVKELANSRLFNPIQQYLESLPDWDGVPRVETLFVDYFGADDNPYTRDVARKWVLAAIKRVYQPGCKYDYVPVLSGPQGIGKSTFFKKLGVLWFSDSLTFSDMSDVKKAAEKIQGTWINELSELNGIRKQDIGTVKNFISSSKDIFRAAYAATAQEYPRRCVMIGTTNDDNFLFDDTGNRRFQPIKVTGDFKPGCDPTKISDKTVQQIWAEALDLYLENSDVELCLEPENNTLAVEAQMDALEASDLEGVIEYYLDMYLPLDWDDMTITQRQTYIQTYVPEDPEHPSDRKQRTEVSIPEVFCECLGQPIDRLTKAQSRTIGRCLTKLHWGAGDENVPGFPVRKSIPHYGQNRMRYPYKNFMEAKKKFQENLQRIKQTQKVPHHTEPNQS